MENLVGKKFNFLTILSTCKIDKRDYCYCVCDCGKTKYIKTYSIITGYTKSCGHLSVVYNNKLNLIGQKFGRLLVLGYSSQKHRQTKFKCICDCGNIVDGVFGFGLKNGRTLSCGCYCLEKIQKHKKYGSSEYRCWVSMIQRCYNKNNRKYKIYGERGIKVCESWKNSFINFYKDMGDKPSKRYSLDRIDVNGDYEPNNCRWATIEQQNRNRRNIKMYEFNGEFDCLMNWAEKFGISKDVIRNRVRQNWDMYKIYNYYLNKNKK